MRLGKRTKYRANALALILIAAGILVALNSIFSRYFFRLDLTAGREYTLAASTKGTLGNLDDIVTVKVYFSKKLPPYLTGFERQVRDTLDEMRSYAKGKLAVERIDPAEDPRTQESMQLIGIPQVQLNVRERDRVEVMNAYLGIGVFYEDKKEVIPIVSNTLNLEYDLISAIVKLTSSQVRTVGFLKGHGESGIYGGQYETIAVLLRGQYKVVEVDTTGGSEVPGDVNTLVVAGPKNLAEADKYEIDQFLMRGGKAIFLIDPIQMLDGTLQAIPLDSKIDDMLSTYGVRLGKDLVLDRVNSNATFSTGLVRFSLPYPFWPKVVRDGLDRTSPIVSQLESLVLPWTSSLEIIGGKDLRVTVLARSTNAAWTESGRFNLDPQQQFFPTQESQKSYPLSVLISGRFKSFYSGKEIPEALAKETSSKPKENIAPLTESPETSIIVVGSSHFISNGFITQFNSNRIFFQNALDLLTLGDRLIGIRSRNVSDRPIMGISELGKTYIRFLNIAGAPILVALFGLFRFYSRRRARSQVVLLESD